MQHTSTPAAEIKARRLKKPGYDEAKKLITDALEAGDEVFARSILFIGDSLFFWEFCDAVRDVGRMWVAYDFWVFIDAGCRMP